MRWQISIDIAGTTFCVASSELQLVVVACEMRPGAETRDSVSAVGFANYGYWSPWRWCANNEILYGRWQNEKSSYTFLRSNNQCVWALSACIAGPLNFFGTHRDTLWCCWRARPSCHLISYLFCAPASDCVVHCRRIHYIFWCKRYSISLHFLLRAWDWQVGSNKSTNWFSRTARRC